jgi:hypothetical protein
LPPTSLIRRIGPDGVSFVAVVVVDDPARLAQLPVFSAYRAGLDQRCDEPPVTTEPREIGAFTAS